jgi:hypothetical protein
MDSQEIPRSDALCLDEFAIALSNLGFPIDSDWFELRAQLPFAP